MIDLIGYIRDFVADKDGDRWTDKRILYLIDKAQTDLARRTNILHKEVNVRIVYKKVDGVMVGYKIDLPDDIIRLIKVLDEDKCVIPIQTTSERASFACATSCECVGDLTHVVPDHYGRNTLGLICNPEMNKLAPSVYYCSDILKCYTLLPCSDKVVYRPSEVTVIYNNKPTPITSIDDKLEVDSICEQAIKFYVCGMLLRDDKDSGSRSLGNEELQMYAAELKQLKKERQLNFYDGTSYSTGYRRGV